MGSDFVRLTRAAIDDGPNGDIVVRGVIDPSTFHLIKIDTYQREILPLSSLSSLVEAFAANKQVPDITLGLRGGDFREKNGEFELKADTYVIDGLQRISSAQHAMRTNRNAAPHLGAIVHFNTTRASEDLMFRILNTRSVKLSPNILIRNLKDTNVAIDMLMNLCHDRSFSLADRVCWNQRMKRGELMTALTFISSIAVLHSSFGSIRSSRWDDIARGLERTMRTVGRTTMRENIRVFYEAIDAAFGVRELKDKEGATQLRGGFLQALALVVAHHRNFWDDNRKLTISADMKRKLGSFAIEKEAVKGLAGGNAKGRTMLYRFIVDHLNSGKRVHRLVPFKKSDPIQVSDDADVIDIADAERREIRA